MGVRGAVMWTVLRIRMTGPNRKGAEHEGID